MGGPYRTYSTKQWGDFSKFVKDIFQVCWSGSAWFRIQIHLKFKKQI